MASVSRERARRDRGRAGAQAARRWRSPFGYRRAGLARAAALQADRGERILQRAAARADACAHRRPRPAAAGGLPERLERASQARAHRPPGQELDGDPQRPEKRAASQRRPRPGPAGACGRRGSHSDQAAVERILEVPARAGDSCPFARAAAARDEAAQCAVAGAVGGERDELESVTASELAPMMSGSAACLAATWARTTPASEHSSVSASAAIAELPALRDELFGMRGAAQKGEVAQGSAARRTRRDASSEHAVHDTSASLPLAKDPQPRAPRSRRDVIVARDIRRRPTSRSRCARDLPREGPGSR